jgi:hypothetical protein
MTQPETLSIEARRHPADADYLPLRKEQRRRMSESRSDRRVEVGPFATFYFENYETIRHQIQEMLYIEKGGEAQIADELEAYGSADPQGRRAGRDRDVRGRRRRSAAATGSCSASAASRTTTLLRSAARRSAARPTPDRENTSPDGKASSVQFFHFPLTEAQIRRWPSATPATQVLIGFDHPNYGHIAVDAGGRCRRRWPGICRGISPGAMPGRSERVQMIHRPHRRSVPRRRIGIGGVAAAIDAAQQEQQRAGADQAGGRAGGAGEQGGQRMRHGGQSWREYGS